MIKKAIRSVLNKNEKYFNYIREFEDFCEITIRDERNNYRIIKFDNEFFDEISKSIWRMTQNEKIMNTLNKDIGYVLFGTNNLLIGFKNRDINDYRKDNLFIRSKNKNEADRSRLPKYIYEENDSRGIYKRIFVRIREKGHKKCVFTKSFSVNKYGYNGAIFKAIVARNNFLNTLEN